MLEVGSLSTHPVQWRYEARLTFGVTSSGNIYIQHLNSTFRNEETGKLKFTVQLYLKNYLKISIVMSVTDRFALLNSCTHYSTVLSPYKPKNRLEKNFLQFLDSCVHVPGRHIIYKLPLAFELHISSSIMQPT